MPNGKSDHVENMAPGSSTNGSGADSLLNRTGTTLRSVTVPTQSNDSIPLPNNRRDGRKSRLAVYLSNRLTY